MWNEYFTLNLSIQRTYVRLGYLTFCCSVEEKGTATDSVEDSFCDIRQPN